MCGKLTKGETNKRERIMQGNLCKAAYTSSG